MRSVFIIREKQTQTFCTSSKSGVFGPLDAAAIFTSVENAVKAEKNLLRMLDWAVTGQDVRDVYYCKQEQLDAVIAYHGVAAVQGVKLLGMDLEIVEFNLKEVK